MQRLLRGWLLYVALSGFVMYLYNRTVHMEPVQEARTGGAVQAMPAMEWWPKQLDAPTLQRLALEKPHAASALSFLTLLGIGMAAWGLVLTVQVVATGRIRNIWRFRSPPLPAWSFGEVVRILILITLVASLVPFVRMALTAYDPRWPSDTHFWMPMSMLILDAFAILAVLTFAQGKPGSAWKAIGLVRGTRDTARLTLRSYVAMLPWLIGLLAIVVELARVFHLTPPTEPIHEMIFQEHRPWVFAMTVALACVVGPVAEEIMFRGVIYASLRRKMSRWLAMAVCGAVFAVVHTNIIGFLPIMGLGFLLSYLYERTGSLLSPIAVHVAHNTLLMTVAIIFRDLLAGA